MATYLIGDVQGCYTEWQALFAQFNFDFKTDHIWFLGDLINRGHGALEMAEWILNHRKNCQTVIGNHDLYVLAVQANIRQTESDDTLDKFLNSAIANTFCEWLREQPFFQVDSETRNIFVHAGLAPQASVETMQKQNLHLQNLLQSENYISMLKAYFEADRLDTLSPSDDFIYWLQVFTTLRFCLDDGTLNFSHKGKLEDAPLGFKPWFEFPRSESPPFDIWFGHWAYLRGVTNHPYAHCLDTGCVWGEALTAVRLEDKKFFTVKSQKRK